MSEEKKTILLVEDDRFLSEMYATKLSDGGFEVETAGDGQEALKIAKAKNPDLILLDIVLPKMDGFEFLQLLKNDATLKNIAVVILTNLGQKEEVEKGLKLGASDYIIKAHFTPTEVVAKVKKILQI